MFEIAFKRMNRRFPVYEMAPKAFELLKLMNLVNRMHSHLGSDIARLINGAGGKGYGKTQMPHCNDADRDFILIRKDADLPLVH